MNVACWHAAQPTILLSRFPQLTHMTSQGTHLFTDFWGCTPAVLQDEELLRRTVTHAVQLAGATLCALHSVPFPSRVPGENGGVTVVAILAESHLTIHTYPEAEFAAVDLYTCGPRGTPRRGLDYFKEVLRPSRYVVREVVRGVDPEPRLSLMGH